MITIVHGDDVSASRDYFLKLKDKDSLTFDAENLSLVELEQSMQDSGLFSPSKKIFVENLFSKKALKNFDSIVKLFDKKQKDIEVYIWSDKILSTKLLSALPKHNAHLFKIPQNIWAFVDGIRPNNNKNVSLFHKVLVETESEIIFAMIVRQFRLMLGLLGNSNTNIDEVKRLVPWQRGKLLRQSSMFGFENLKKIYKQLYKIDKSQKTGRSQLTLIQNIDILLLGI